MVGLAECVRDCEIISETIKTKMDPIPEIHLVPEKVDGKKIIVLTVFPGKETPYYYIGDGNRQAFVRIGNESVIADRTAIRRLVKSMGWEVQPSCTWCRHSFATNLTHAGVSHNYISESMGHSVDSNITNLYIDAFPLSQQMEFNSRLLKLNDDADILEELKGLTPEQLKALIAMVKNA